MEKTQHKGYHDIPCTDREEWLKEREKGIGSSEAGTIAGINAFDTPLRLWRRKMKIDPPVKETIIMKMGHALEPLVAEEFALATGCIMDPESVPDFLCVDDEKPWRRVSPDRFFWEKGMPESQRTRENAFILECKSTDKHVTPYSIPAYWFNQVQYQMAVTRTKYCYIAWIERGRGLFNYTCVQAIPAFQEVLLDSVDRFWLHNVEGRIQPAVIIDDLDAVLRFDAAEAASTVEADTEIARLIGEYREYEPDVTAKSDRMDAIKTALKAYMGNMENLTLPDGEIVATWKAPRDKEGTPTGARRFVVRKKKKDADEKKEVTTDYLGKGAVARSAGFRTRDEIPANTLFS